MVEVEKVAVEVVVWTDQDQGELMLVMEEEKDYCCYCYYYCSFFWVLFQFLLIYLIDIE